MSPARRSGPPPREAAPRKSTTEDRSKRNARLRLIGGTDADPAAVRRSLGLHSAAEDAVRYGLVPFDAPEINGPDPDGAA